MAECSAKWRKLVLKDPVQNPQDIFGTLKPAARVVLEIIN
jgi:hypothetical protein